MGNITSELSNGIKIFESLYGFGKIVLVKARNRITTPYRVEKLSDDIFSSVISFGNVITVNGNFTKYGTTYRPLSYAPAIPAKSSERRIGYADPKTRRLQEKWENETKFRLFQFPVQTLPAFEDGKGRFCVAFLYPENFEGFILKGDPNKKGKSIADKLLIESMHQAIPILLPEETLENISESNVTLTGIVSLLPENVIDSISKDICTTREAFYYGFLRPYSSRIAFCIDCRDKINSDFSVNNKISSLPAALYIEGHFEGIVENKYEKEFNQSIPHGLSLAIVDVNYPGKKYYLTEDESVSVIGSDPSIFGFYIEADLVNSRDFYAKLKHLEEFYAEFRKKSLNKIRSAYSIEARFKPDFIFDYKRQRYFHPDGALSSKEVDEVLKKHQEIIEVAEWLKNAK